MTIFERAKQLNLPFGEYAIVGSAVLEAHGIREANDIDLLVSPRLFESLLKNGWQLCECEKCQALWQKREKKKILTSPGHDVEMLSEFSWGNAYRGDTAALMSDADIIGGFPFIKIEELLKWKKAAMREKDLKDIALIEAYLENHAQQ